MNEPRTKIVQDRQETHGDPVVNMQRIAQAWSAILGVEVTPANVGRCMSALHLVRDAAATVRDPSHLEHADGYNDITRMVAAEREQQAENLYDTKREVSAEGDTGKDSIEDEVAVSIATRDPDAPWILKVDEHDIWIDEDGVTHNPFVQNRRVVVLSLPRGIDLNAPTTAARDLLETVQYAMEVEE